MSDDSKDPKNDTERAPPHDEGQIIDDVAADLVDLQAAVRGVDAGLVSAHKRPPMPLAPNGELIDFGYVRPVVETVLPLSHAKRAHQISAAGHARGKIVLSVE